MDYEKAYKEALERAREIKSKILSSHLSTESCKAVSEYIDTIIPELRETEDEIHRKWILEYLYDGLRKADEQFKDHFKAAIDWLEKQKESLHIPETCKEKADSFTSKQKEQKPLITGNDFGWIDELKHDLKHPEELDEKVQEVLKKRQRPVEYADDVVEEAEEYTNKVYCREYGVEVTEAYIAGVLSERNRGTKWSEEEKDKLNSIERLIVNANAHGNYLIGDKEATDLQHFIRSIVKPTTNLAEWSEEDERKRQACISTINEVIDYERERWEDYNPGKPYRPIMKYDEQIDWLKSLRPSWKPSEDEERLINTSISFLKDFADKGYENAVECIDWLKSKLNGNSCK